MIESNVDFSYQLTNLRERVEKRIFNCICEISRELFAENKYCGSLIVLGIFKSHVPGMRQLGGTKLEKYINVMGANEDEFINMIKSGDDGSIVISDSGQVLGTGIYLMVDNPTVDVPEGAGTRHISAASFSTRDEVIAAFTLSEETRVVRRWKDGAVVEQFDPSDKEK